MRAAVPTSPGGRSQCENVTDAATLLSWRVRQGDVLQIGSLTPCDCVDAGSSYLLWVVTRCEAAMRRPMARRLLDTFCV